MVQLIIVIKQSHDDWKAHVEAIVVMQPIEEEFGEPGRDSQQNHPPFGMLQVVIARMEVLHQL